MSGAEIIMLATTVAAAPVAYLVCHLIREGRREMEDWGAFADSDARTARAAEDLE